MIDVDALRAAGLTEAQIAAVFEVAAPLITELKDLRERKTARREQNRKRQQDHRARQRDSNPVSVTCQRDSQRDIKKPNGINGHVSMTAETLFSTESSKKERKIERGCRLPETWVPSAKHFELGMSLGMSRDEVLFHADAFREWAWGNANRAVGRKANWDLAFNGWLRRERQSKKTDLFKAPRSIRII